MVCTGGLPALSPLDEHPAATNAAKRQDWLDFMSHPELS
jgi:hypothetical protein